MGFVQEESRAFQSCNFRYEAGICLAQQRHCQIKPTLQICKLSASRAKTYMILKSAAWPSERLKTGEGPL